MEALAPATRGLRPLIGWKRYSPIGLIFSLIVLIVGIPIAWVKGTSTYTAEGIFQVAPAYQKNLSADKDLELQSNSQYREFVNHLSRSVLRYDVLERALKDLAAKGISPLLPSEDVRKCIERLQRTITIFPIADTYMVKVVMQSTEKKNLDDIVNTIMDSFLAITKGEQIFGSDERARVLGERTTLVRQEISQFDAERAQLAGVLGLTTFGENTVNPFDMILAQAREKLTTATIERSQAQAILDAFAKQQESPASAGRSLLEMRLQDQGLQAMRNEVVKRSQELGRVSSGLQDSHPAKMPALAEDAEINRRLQATEATFDKNVKKNVLSRFKASLQQTGQVEKELLARVRNLESQASNFATNFREAMRITGEIKKREQELGDLRARGNYLETESNAIGFVRLITRALPAVTPQGLGKTKMFLALLIVSAIVALVVPMMIDLLDRRVLTVGDAEKAFGTRAAAWVVDGEDEPSRVIARDQLRRFASTLNRNRSRGGTGAFGFSSVKADGESAQLILGVAHTLQSLGNKVLVVDANSLVNHSPLTINSAGLTDMLSGEVSSQDVICAQRPGMDDQLACVPFGQARDTGIQRLDILRTALTQWLTDYELVLIDLPPIVSSADAELLIDAVGQVFLVVEAAAVTKMEVTQARDQLEKIAPEAVGLIVNKLLMENIGKDVRSRVVESVSGKKFQSFMSKSEIKLHLQLLGLRWTQFWRRKSSGRN